MKEKVFTTDLDAIKKNKEHVQRLYLPAFVVEIELVAVFSEVTVWHPRPADVARL